MERIFYTVWQSGDTIVQPQLVTQNIPFVLPDVSTDVKSPRIRSADHFKLSLGLIGEGGEAKFKVTHHVG